MGNKFNNTLKRVSPFKFKALKHYKINLRSKMSDVRSLVHIDAYRLSRGEELTDIGVMDWLGKKDTVTVIEWIENVPGIFNENKIIKIKIDFGEQKDGGYKN